MSFMQDSFILYSLPVLKTLDVKWLIHVKEKGVCFLPVSYVYEILKYVLSEKNFDFFSCKKLFSLISLG